MNAKKAVGAWARAGKDHPRREQLNKSMSKGIGILFDVLKKLRRK